jgi:hypothetical protein
MPAAQSRSEHVTVPLPGAPLTSPGAALGTTALVSSAA